MPFVSVIEMMQVICQIYEANEIEKLDSNKESKEVGKHKGCNSDYINKT